MRSNVERKKCFLRLALTFLYPMEGGWQFQNLLINNFLCFLKDSWIFVAEKQECTALEGPDAEILELNYGTINDCANKCRGLSTMFAVGTNDFGGKRCEGGRCSCICERMASKEGQCKQAPHLGYRLYKYQPIGKFFDDFFVSMEVC